MFLNRNKACNMFESIHCASLKENELYDYLGRYKLYDSLSRGFNINILKF